MLETTTLTSKSVVLAPLVLNIKRRYSTLRQMAIYGSFGLHRYQTKQPSITILNKHSLNRKRAFAAFCRH